MGEITTVETVRDISPNVREIEWHDRPTSHPTDALCIGDLHAALAESYRQTVTYRELAQQALAMVARLTETNNRLTAALREMRHG